MREEPPAGKIAPIELPPRPASDPDSDPLATAVVDEFAEESYERATIEGVVRRAGVSRDEFDRRFASLDACALDAYERFISVFQRRVGSAFNGQDEWVTALRAAAYECADWMAENPNLVVFGMPEVLKMRSELARVRREEVLAFCSEIIDRGREAAPDPDSIPQSAPIVAIGAIAQLLTHRVQEGARVDPHEVIPEMMHRIVSSYLGPEAAEAEWTAPRP